MDGQCDQKKALAIVDIGPTYVEIVERGQSDNNFGLSSFALYVAQKSREKPARRIPL